MKTQGGHLIHEADGIQPVFEGFDEEASAQEGDHFRAFCFSVRHRNSCPEFVVVVFAEEQELPLFAFQADGLEFVRIVTRHALDELDERFQFSRVEGDVRLGVVGIGNGLPPVGIIPFDLLADKPPTPAGELHSFTIDLHLPLTICIELFPFQELVIRDDDGVLERELERIRAVEVLSVSAYNVVGFGIAGVDEGAVEDVTSGINTGTFHSFMNGSTKLWRQCDGVGFDAWSYGELVGGDVFHLLFSETVRQGEFNHARLNVDALVLPAVLGDLRELVIRNEHSHRRTFGWMLKTHGDEAIKIGAGESNPTI